MISIRCSARQSRVVCDVTRPNPLAGHPVVVAQEKEFKAGHARTTRDPREACNDYRRPPRRTAAVGSREPFRHSRSCAHPPLLTLLVSRLRTGISVACWSERRPLGSNAENLTEESVTSEQRVLRLASIVAFVLGAILVAIGVYRYVNGGGLSSPIGAGLGAMVIAGICSQIANRGRDQREGHGKNPLRFRADRLSALAIRRRPAPSIRGS